MVVIFEDLHWIDAQTRALLDLLADSIATAQVLLLVNYRPEYSDQWNSKTYYSQIRLDPLDRANGAAMLTALLGDAVALNPLERLIVERTGGNPFFIEEIVQALFDEGALVRNGAVKVTRSLSQLRLPPTVQGILAARIDRQPSEHKTLLQTLAVIGRESSLGLIRHVVSTTDTELAPMLSDLRAGEFIYEQPAAGGVEYVFKHALTQEVAYNSLLIERRKQIHEHAGHALESIFSDQLDDHLTQLAHHYGHSDNLDKAIEYLGRAGQQALQRSAHADAISSLTLAIDLLRKLPDRPERIKRELRLQLALGSASIPVTGWAAPEVERAFTRTRELCEQLANPPELFPTLFGLWVMYFIRAESGKAYELAEQLLQLAQDADAPAHLLLAHQAMGNTLYMMGEFLLALEHLETGISLYDRERQRPRGFRLGGVNANVNCLLFAAWSLWTLGYPNRALERANEGIALAQTLSHPHTLGFAEHNLGVLHQLRREAHAAQENAETGIALAAEHGFAQLLAWATIYWGWTIAALGHDEGGITRILEGLAMSRATGGEALRPYHLYLLADAYVETGHLIDGLGALAEALAASDEHKERSHESEIYRLKGELLLKQNESNGAEAQSCFERAIDIARKQSAKSYELRATTSIARLLRKQGKHDEARAMLADIYNWFTEGFDTADLIDAKALLDEFST